MKKRIYFVVAIMLLLFQFGYAQECGIVYVTPSGASSGTPGTVGTKSNPANLIYGIQLASNQNPIIRIAVGTYLLNNPLVIKDSITLEGGYLPLLNWAKTNGDSTVFYRDSSNVQANPARLVGIECISRSYFRIQDIRLRVAAAPSAGVSVYGIYLNSCFGYSIVRCQVRTGKGGDGIDGVDGQNGNNGAPGLDGKLGSRRADPILPPFIVDGGNGGNGWSSGACAGGHGGDGGQRGTGSIDINNLCDPNVASAPDGLNGSAGSGVTPGSGGAGSDGLCYCNNALTPQDIISFLASCPSSDTIYWGRNGINGQNGFNGADGVNGDSIYASGYFNPSIPQSGTDGSHGSGGGGGGGGGSIGCVPDPGHGTILSIGDLNSSGAGGGGGGEGGQAGTKGTAGTNGGGSFAVFCWNSGPGGIIRDCVLQTMGGGKAGKGGVGGSGGTGGFGGLGGNDLLMNSGSGSGCEGGAGGDGGNGGAGGDGGNGGNGAIGPNIPLLQDPNGVPVLYFSTFEPLEAPITVSYTGCTNAPIQLSTTATGSIIEWNLAGNPSSATGSTVSVEYDVTGFKTIVLRIDGIPFTYSEFININTLFPKPIIQATASTICAGSNITLTTAATAFNYNWQIPGGSITSYNQQNPGSVTFSIPGVYPIQLQTTTCCGLSRIDTFTVTVINQVTISLGKDDTLCHSDPFPTLSVAQYPNSAVVWTLNGNFMGNSPTLTANQAGQYIVSVDYGGSCSGSDTFNLTLISNLIVNIGGNQDVCAGVSPQLLNAGYPGSRYNWTRDGIPVGTSQTLQPNLPGRYSVVVTKPSGCSGTDFMDLTIIEVTENLGPDRQICPKGGLPSLQAQTQNATYEWSLNGSIIGTNSSQPITTSGLYKLVSTNAQGCLGTDSVMITVGELLSPNFGAPASIMINTPLTFQDQSVGATSWLWNFGDGSNVSFDQNPTHTYTTPGEKAVFLVVTNGICTDTVIKVVNVLLDCSTTNVVAAFTPSVDTIWLSGQGTVSFINQSTNALHYLWQFGDTTTSYDESPDHAYSTPGTYTITLIASNFNCADTTSRAVVVLTVVGTEDLVGRSVSLYPNPASETVRLNLQNITGWKKALLFDITGREILSISLPEAGGITLISVADLPSGVYQLKVLNNGGTASLKLVKH